MRLAADAENIAIISDFLDPVNHTVRESSVK